MAVPQDYIQRECHIKLGLTASTTEYEVTKAKLVTRFEMVTLPPTSRNARKRQIPAAYEQTIEIDYNSMNTRDQAYLDGLFAAALLPAATPSSSASILYFDLVFTDTTVGANNQRFTGTAYVPEVTRGGAIGSLRSESVSLSVQSFDIANA